MTRKGGLATVRRECGEALALDDASLQAARDINAPNTFGQITSTVNTARTVQLVLKVSF